VSITLLVPFERAVEIVRKAEQTKPSQHPHGSAMLTTGSFENSPRQESGQARGAAPGSEQLQMFDGTLRNLVRGKALPYKRLVSQS
jgi:hypothetical protein